MMMIYMMISCFGLTNVELCVYFSNILQVNNTVSGFVSVLSIVILNLVMVSKPNIWYHDNTSLWWITYIMVTPFLNNLKRS